MDMVSVGQQAVSFFNHVGGERLARSSAEAEATKAANHTTDSADACSIAGSSPGSSALANLDGGNNRALCVSYYHGKNHEREGDQNRA
jgi:hypothetical protein